MGDRDHGAFVPLQMLFDPGHGFRVQMVGRFIKKQDIRFLKQEPAQGNPAPLAA